MSRTVTLILLDAAGRPLGALPSFDVPEPWWQEVASIVAEVRRRHGLEVAVLRLLDADRPAPPGGHVRYLAQTADAPAVPLEPVAVDLAPHPLRLPWRRPAARTAASAGRRVSCAGSAVG